MNKSQCVAIEKDRFDFENIFGMLKDELEKDDAFKKKRTETIVSSIILGAQSSIVSVMNETGP